MKKLYPVGIILWFLSLSQFAFAQLSDGGINAYFGIDGDTRSYRVKYGPSIGMIASDDWFSPTPSTKNVIDTTNAAYYALHLSMDENLAFSKRMSVPLFSKINGKLWLDAVYGRDYLATSPLTDSNAFTIACKNGDNPGNWVGGSTNFPDKNDLVDVYAHMRRDGTNITDSLWFFTGVSTVGTSGSRYFDIELYKKDFSYNGGTGVFTTAGTEAGHTEWIFDASGNIIQTGDMIVAVNYSPGSAPVVDLRIWVSDNTFNTAMPAYFDFEGTFDGSTPAYGYASILSKTGTTEFGSGIANYSATPAKDTTYSTPWGTEQSTKIWGTQYQTLQLIEIGLNLTRIGVDPALYTAVGLNPCESMFSSIFFKSRSSNSFLSNMQDFVAPMTFLRTPVMDYTVTPDALRCNKSTGSILLTPNSTMGYYTWQTPNGTISSSNSDSSQINVSSTGTYIVKASPIQGCPPTRSDTIIIQKDTFPPIASIFTAISPTLDTLIFFGGDAAASNYPTPFGGSQGLLWDWSGPGGFTSSIQNPKNDTVWGTYQLIVTEIRNGCKDTISTPISYLMFGILAQNSIKLEGKYANENIQLNWQSKGAIDAVSYTIEKSTNGRDFSPIGVLTNSGADQYFETGYFQFEDEHPSAGNNFYRVKIVTKWGVIAYSNISLVGAEMKIQPRIFISADPSGANPLLNVNTKSGQQATLVFYTAAGEKLGYKKILINAGSNHIPIVVPGNGARSVTVVSLYMDNRVVFTGKLLK